MLKANCGWLTHGRFLFFARAKKRNQKKTRPGARDPFLRSSPHRALANSPGAYDAPRAQTRDSLEYSRWVCGTRRALRGVEQPTSDWYAEVFSQPPRSSRAPSEAEARARRGEQRIASVRRRDREVASAHPLRRTRREGTRDVGGRRPGGALSFRRFWPAPSLARALRAHCVRPILLPAKLSLGKQRQIRRDRI